MTTGISIDTVLLSRGKKHVAGPISLAFPKGQLTAIIGPNGAGKTSLLDASAGLLRPVSGEIRLEGKPLAQWPRKELARIRAYLPQRATIGWPITVERVVALGLTPHLPAFGELPTSLAPAIDAALDATGIRHLRTRAATALSGGELARTMLARAIVGNPAYLLVDEPTAGLDPRHAYESVQRLQARTQNGATVIMAIHDLDLALNHADVLVAMKDGQVIGAGSVSQIATNETLSLLYDMPVAVAHDDTGYTVRFSAPGSEFP